ncbi:MAG TPA: phage tail assembly chaperone [Alphaproteobacteria bacterium]|nr:phage tail assembly chaperone [Alphaproteobacteria bacterium]
MQEFFFGVLGWSPRQFWDEATYFDVMAALDGWLAANHPAPAPDVPSKDFLNDMMQRFPDEQ